MHLGDVRKFLWLDLGQKSYAEIFKFTECRHGTRNLVESSAGKKKKVQTEVWTLLEMEVPFMDHIIRWTL